MDALLRRIGDEAGLILIVAIVMLAVALPILMWRIRAGVGVRSSVWKTGLDAAVLASLAVIGLLTLGAFHVGGEGAINLVPFQSLFDSFVLGEFWVGIAVADLLGNFLLFVPLGLFLGLRFARLPIWIWTLIAFALTAAIEIVQFVALNRSADVTDVVMNGLGGVAGFAGARLSQRLVRAHRREPAGSS